MRRSLSQIDWATSMLNLQVNDQVNLPTTCVTNIFKIFVPSKTIVCKDKDPPWITDEIKRVCIDKAKVYRQYVKNDYTINDKINLQNLASYSTRLINDAKTRYLSGLGEKLNELQIGCKAYWSILNKFINKKKIPLIPPISINNNFITDVSEKARLFNIFFATQCTLIDNNSTLPAFSSMTNCELNTININKNILNAIRALNPNKAHGWDGVSIVSRVNSSTSFNNF